MRKLLDFNIGCKRKLDIEKVLRIVCFMTIAVACYSILTYGQTDIHSDTATATLLAQSQIRNQSLFPISWNYANGEIWGLSINIFTMPFTLLLYNQTLARMLGSVALVLVTVLCMYFHCKKVFKNTSWIISVPVFLVFLMGEKDVILYQAAYDMIMVWITLCTALSYQAVFCEKKKGWFVMYIAASFLFSIGGIRFWAEVVIPLWAAYMIVIYINICKKEHIEWMLVTKKLFFITSIIVTPAMAGYGVYKWLCTTHNVNKTVRNSIMFEQSLENCANNIKQSFINIFANFGYSGNEKLLSIQGISNIVLIIMCIIIFFIVPILQWKRLNEEKEEVLFFFIYGAVHNGIMIVLSVLFGKAMEVRYLLTAIFVTIIISARYIWVYWIHAINMKKVIWSGLFVIAVVVQCSTLSCKSVGWRQRVDEKKRFCQELVDQGLSKGYATYWNAYSNEIYSDMQLKFRGVYIEGGAMTWSTYLTPKFGSVYIGESPCLTPYSWLVDSKTYTVEDLKTFLLLSEEENTLMRDKLEYFLGKPIDRFCLYNMYVYVYDHDISIDFSNGIADGILKPLELTGNDNTKITREQVVIEQDGLVYGSNISMKKGSYTISFRGEGLNIAECDIYSSESEAFAWSKLEQSNNCIVVQLELEKDIQDIEFRLFQDAENQVVILHEIDIQ